MMLHSHAFSTLSSQQQIIYDLLFSGWLLPKNLPVCVFSHTTSIFVPFFLVTGVTFFLSLYLPFRCKQMKRTATLSLLIAKCSFFFVSTEEKERKEKLNNDISCLQAFVKIFPSGNVPIVKPPPKYSLTHTHTFGQRNENDSHANQQILPH